MFGEEIKDWAYPELNQIIIPLLTRKHLIFVYWAPVFKKILP
jgi:hypothetical protein